MMKTDFDVSISLPLGRRTFLRSMAALGASVALPARAESTGRVFCGYVLTPAPDGVVTAVLRGLQSNYSPNLGSRLVYKPGNGNADAADAVATAEPDGSTVLFSSSAEMTLAPMTSQKVVRADLLPVGGIGELTYAFIVGPVVPADIKSLPEFLLWAGLNPGFARYGVPGRGTAAHFVGSEVVRLSGVPLRSIGYRGIVPLMEDVASGQMAAGVVAHLGSFDAGKYPKLRTLAVSSRARWSGNDDVPTLMELGYAKSPITTSLGFYVSRRTPEEKATSLSNAIDVAVQDPAVRVAMASAGLLPLAQPANYAALVDAEREAWKARIEQFHFNSET